MERVGACGAPRTRAWAVRLTMIRAVARDAAAANAMSGYTGDMKRSSWEARDRGVDGRLEPETGGHRPAQRGTLCLRGHMTASHSASGARRTSTTRRRVMATVAGRSASTCAGWGKQRRE